MKDIQVRWTVQIKSEEGKTLKKPTEFLNRLISAAAAGEFDEIYRLWTRVAEAARKGGASKSDLLTIGMVLTVSLREMERARRIEPLAATRHAAVEALKKINAGRSVTPELRSKVVALDTELAAEYPVKSPRYDEIDRRMGWRRGRTRYILEGPRKGKRE